MKIDYYPETDSMYIELSSGQSSETEEIAPGVQADYDDKGNLVGIDIDNVSKKADISEVILNRFPAKIQKISA